MNQAILTRYHGPGNVRGSRIKATAAAGSVTVSYDSSIGIEENHRRAAEKLAAKYGWKGRLHGGGMPKTGYCFVTVDLHDVGAADVDAQLSKCRHRDDGRGFCIDCGQPT